MSLAIRTGAAAALRPSVRSAHAPGACISGKYRVERILGEGGMGVVVEATHLALGQRVAVKLLRRDVAAQEDALRRFLREAQIAAQLPGDHIARATDFGQTESGEAFLVMELLVGRDLESELQVRGRLAMTEAVDCVLQACEGVAEAHAVGLVHRDLKPANLFLTRRRDGTPLVKVLDFGISKWALGVVNVSLTARTAACGTPAYMAPEQFDADAAVDARCDQHALGTVLYELISGGPAFTGPNLPALSIQIMQKPPPKLRAAVPGAPAGLEAAIERALAKRPEDRFADLASFARAIAPFGGPGAEASANNIARVLEAAVPGASLHEPDDLETRRAASTLEPPRDTLPQGSVAGAGGFAREGALPPGISGPGPMLPDLPPGGAPAPRAAPDGDPPPAVTEPPTSFARVPTPPHTAPWRSGFSRRKALYALASAAVLLGIGWTGMLLDRIDAPAASAETLGGGAHVGRDSAFAGPSVDVGRDSAFAGPSVAPPAAPLALTEVTPGGAAPDVDATAGAPRVTPAGARDPGDPAARRGAAGARGPGSAAAAPRRSAERAGAERAGPAGAPGRSAREVFGDR